MQIRKPEFFSKIKEKIHRSKKRTVFIIVGIWVLFVFVAVGLFLMLKPSENERAENVKGNRPNRGEQQFTVTENTVMASGVTSVGVVEETFEVENLSTALEIEEVYISAEDEIEAGTKILKLSDESVAEVREELEQELLEAELAGRAGAIEYEQSKITALYDRDSKILSGKQAKEVYDETIASLDDAVNSAQEKVDEAKEQIAEYQSYVTDDGYKTYFKVDEYQATYDGTLAALMEKMDEWGVSWPQVTGQGGGNGGFGGTLRNTEQEALSESGRETGEGSEGESTLAVSSGPTSDQVMALSMLYDVLEVQKKKLDQAWIDYEAALINAPFELQTLEFNLPGLENDLLEAQKTYQEQVLQAEVTYQTTLADAESAQEDYEIAIQKAQTDYDKLQNEWEDAKENLELFEQSVGDGYYYATGSGTVLRSMVRAGRTLVSESTIFMYSNPDEMTVTVSVGQSDIAKIALEDCVYIQSTEYGGFDGVVTEIHPVSNSDSRTNVTYSVVVTFQGEDFEIPANKSVTVMFGVEKSENMERPEGMARPEGMTPPEGMEFPEGMTPPEGMEFHEGMQRPERREGQRKDADKEE